MDLGRLFTFAAPARPDKRDVDDTLKPKVFQIIAVAVDFPKSHGFAAVFTCMEGMRCSNANVQSGRKGRCYCRTEYVCRAKARRSVKQSQNFAPGIGVGHLGVVEHFVTDVVVPARALCGGAA